MPLNLPGNYPTSLLKGLKEKEVAHTQTWCHGRKDIVVGLLDIHRFTAACHNATASSSKVELEAFFDLFYPGVVPAFSGQDGEINKLMGDGVFATFPSVFSALQGSMRALKWWEVAQPVFPSCFRRHKLKLMAFVGILNIHSYRLGCPEHYIDTSWVGAELNTFFKDAKDDVFSDHPDTCCWFNEKATNKLEKTLKQPRRRLLPTREAGTKNYCGLSISTGDEWLRGGK